MKLITPVFVLLLLAATLALAKPETSSSVDTLLQPSTDHGQAGLWAHRMISSFHYRSRPLDDELSSEIFDRYLDSLDGDRSFLLQSDVQAFEKYRTLLDDALLKQELSAPFELFNVYMQRIQERVTHAEALLEQGFGFGVEESIDLDVDERDWAESSEALDELWRKRVKNDWLRLRLAGRDDEAIVTTLTQRYQNYGKRMGEIKPEDVFQMFMNAYAGSIEPHTSYMGPRASENFQISMRLSLEGIGAVLQRDNNDHTVVRSVVPGGPAGMQGVLREGDRILAVGQGESGPMVDVVGWRLDDVVDLIRGPKDSVVRLDILPAEAGLDGAPTQLAITRQRVKLEEQAARSSIIEIGEDDASQRIGVVRLPTFYMDFEARRRGDPDYRSTTRDVRKLLTELAADDVDGIVVDLRDNGGGSLAEATELTGLFIDSGPVVQVKDGRGVQIESDPNGGIAYDGPLAVLVNRNSASASEIFAAALQDYGRALIIGETTFGKGTVQNLMDLDAITRSERPRYGQLKLTVAQFFRITGSSTQHRGVVPDVAFPTAVVAGEYGESSLDNALPYTNIPGVEFTPWSDLVRLVPDLNERHSRRVADDVEFQFLIEDIDLFREAQEQSTFSLVQSERESERDAEEARRKARQERREELGLEPVRELSAAMQTDEDGLELEAEVSENDEDEASKRDVLLTEAAHILGDALDLLREARVAALSGLQSRTRVN